MKVSQAFPFTLLPVQEKPFDHIVQSNFLDRQVYEELERSFPLCPPSSGPSGFSYYWGDEEYDRLITENWAWKTFFETVHSQDFINYSFAQFQRALTTYGCKVSADKAKYVPYQESRQDKENRYLEKVIHSPEQLYVRLDIHQGQVGYSRKSHLDHRRRLATLLIYFSDSDQSGRDGGELVLNERVLGLFPKEAVRIRPQRNLMAGFACSPVSYHSVPKILIQSKPRNFVQIQVSSSVDVWPR